MLLATQAGDVQLQIPKLRKGSFFPVILEPRRRIDQALYAVVMEAYVNGVSTRSVERIWSSALASIGDLQVGGVLHLCGPRRDRDGVPRPSRCTTTFPYVFLDATHLHVRRTGAGGQVTSMAVVIATGVTPPAGGRALGVDVGDSEDEVFWRGFLRSLKERGLQGTQLVT